MPVLCNEVTQCLGSLTFSCLVSATTQMTLGSLTFSRLVSATSTNDVPPYKANELRIAHDHKRP